MNRTLNGAVALATCAAVILLPVTLHAQAATIQVTALDTPVRFYGAAIIGYRVASTFESDGKTWSPRAGNKFLILILRTKPPFELNPGVGFREIHLTDQNGRVYQYNGIPNNDIAGAWIQLEDSDVPKGTKLVIDAKSYEVVFEVPIRTSEMNLKFRGEERQLVLRQP